MKQSKTLERLIETISEECKPEKIFVIGYFEKEETFDHITLDTKPSVSKIANYDLLVLTKDTRPIEQVSNYIEDRTRIIANVTALAYSIDQFNVLLQYGHPFAMKLIQSGNLVYDTKKFEFSNIDAIDITCCPYPGQKEYERARECAEEFVAAFNLHIVRKEYAAAAFSLHQAAEQFYICAIKKATGLRVITSNLLKLQRYSFWFSGEMRKILNYDVAMECHMGELLQKAYYHARYNPDYMITETKLSLLMAEVKKLQQLTDKFLGENEEF